MSVSEAIPVASRLRNQNEILIEKSDEAPFSTKKLQKTQIFIADTAIHSPWSDSTKKLNLRKQI